MEIKPISLKEQIQGAIIFFLEKAKMKCLHTQEGLLQIVNSLSAYKEEGKAFFPEVYVLDDFDVLKNTFKASFLYYIIGEEKKSKTAFENALKKCAPLTENNWSIYILRSKSKIEYGLFSCRSSILSSSASEMLIPKEASNEKVILIHQIADKIVEIKTNKVPSVIINFGIGNTIESSPIEQHTQFIDTIIKNCPGDIKENAKTFYSKLFLEVSQKGHGNLSVVVNHSKLLPKILNIDGVILRPEINIGNTIINWKKEKSSESITNLNNMFSLVLGMLNSDGVTVFNDRGDILAYRVFIQHPQTKTKKPIIGGARSRTFDVLKRNVGKQLESCFMLSQDGKIQIKLK